MARHWSVFVGGVTEKQGMALDRIARKHGRGDGMDLLTELTGNSRSKVGKMDRASLRPYLDDAFAESFAAGDSEAAKQPEPERATAQTVLAASIGMPPTVAADALEDAGHEADAVAVRRIAALDQIRTLMAAHRITAGDLR